MKNTIENKGISQNTLCDIQNKIDYFQQVIQRTLVYIKKTKMQEILGMIDITITFTKLLELSKQLHKLKTITDQSVIILTLQYVNNELSAIFKLYGTERLEDLMQICFGYKYITPEPEDLSKYEVLNNYFHPIYYKLIHINSEIEQHTHNITPTTKSLDCFEIESSVKMFFIKIYGMKVLISNKQTNTHMMLYGIIDDIYIDFLHNDFINKTNEMIYVNLPADPIFKSDTFKQYLKTLSLKDYLIYNYSNIYKHFLANVSSVKEILQKPLFTYIKYFIQLDVYTKRAHLIQLLIYQENYETHYLVSLIYDLLSNDTTGETTEQPLIEDTFPWGLKEQLKLSFKNTTNYTNDLYNNFDSSKIPIEQQICLLKTPDSVKEKAMAKLKELKHKEDSGSKARHYLDGLLKIPFNIYKCEPILEIMPNIKSLFKNLIKKYNIQITPKDKYSNLEILNFLNHYILKKKNVESRIVNINDTLLKEDKSKLSKFITYFNSQVPRNIKIVQTNKTKDQLYGLVAQTIENVKNTLDSSAFNTIMTNLECYIDKNKLQIEKDIQQIMTKFNEVKLYVNNIKTILDNSVYSHNNAKKQIEQIIGQWINGANKGYCFGFEGPPGVGKTSLAKNGVSNCLKDAYGNNRPFAIIQIGGDSNGSTLHGHNYTYVGSTWGNIVQILIDKKCMNPIIFIDEVDKISKTEHGKELVGILTHLLDQTQNDCFQDKYFAGIDLDLSKALFILSYNDVDSIDPILLDRIHRIKFKSLSIEDKLVIGHKYILPEIYKNIGLEDTIEINNDVLNYIIDEYTCESGVRKLKEILFELIGEINVAILKNPIFEDELPIVITINDIKTKYFKEKREIKHHQIHTTSKVGIINGLWANALGKGGALPIQAQLYPSNNFMDLKLTGSQGDVMKESMNVALTFAWNMTSIENKQQLKEKYGTNTIYGVHIHCPDCSTPKNGPSALAAITIVIYSLMNNLKIKNYIGMTGEMTMDGSITEIGGLDLKFLGGIKGGITEFIYPAENEKDYTDFISKYKDSCILKNITFHKVSTIYEVLPLVFEDFHNE